MVETIPEVKQTVPEAKHAFFEPSLQKQRILSRYAIGEIPWKTAADEIAHVNPPTNYSWRQKLALGISALFVFLIPAWARRDET